MLAVALEILLDLSTHALIVRGRRPGGAPSMQGEGSDAHASSDEFQLPDELARSGARLAAQPFGTKSRDEKHAVVPAGELLRRCGRVAQVSVELADFGGLEPCCAFLSPFGFFLTSDVCFATFNGGHGMP